MTEPNSSTTIPNYVAGSSLDNTDIGHRINLLFLRADRAEKQWRDHELMRSRCATIHPSELRSAEEAASSSNTKRPTVPPATPEANGYLGPSWRRAPPRSPGTMNLERPDAAITARGASSAYIAFGLPYPPRHETPSFSPNITHPNAATTNRKSGPNSGTPRGYLGFGVHNQPRHETPTLNPNITHPSNRCRGSPEAVRMERRKREKALREMRRPIIRELNTLRPELPRSNGILNHADAEAINLLTKPVNGTPSNLAARGASRAAQTGASGVAGPSRVVTTVTRCSQSTMSVSEIIWEVRECVVESLNSDVES